MLFRLAALCAAFLVLALPASALTFERCNKVQQKIITEAVAGAEAIALRAAASVGDTPEYDVWFGKFTPENADIVRGNLKSIHRTLQEGLMKAVCPNERDQTCAEAFAYVQSAQPYGVYLCASFFEMPTMANMTPETDGFETGTREGTIIHEISHFYVVAGTEDHCYERTVCARMARRSPEFAIDNADSYQYFAEDLTLFPQVGR